MTSSAQASGFSTPAVASAAVRSSTLGVVGRDGGAGRHGPERRLGTGGRGRRCRPDRVHGPGVRGAARGECQRHREDGGDEGLQAVHRWTSGRERCPEHHRRAKPIDRAEGPLFDHRRMRWARHVSSDAASASAEGLERRDVVGEAGGQLEGQVGIAQVGVGPRLRDPLPAVPVADERADHRLGAERLAPPLLVGRSRARVRSFSAGSRCSAWNPTSMASTAASGTCLAPITCAS